MPRRQTPVQKIQPEWLLSEPKLMRSANHHSFMKQNCEVLAQYLDVMIERTYCKATVRMKDIPLDRTKHKSKQKPEPDSERALEMAIWKTCGLEVLGESEFLPNICRGIVSYQVPIKQTNTDKAGKAIDLLGLSKEGGPVVIELKKGNSKETPLRILVEALNYAIVVRRAWNEGGALRKQWKADLKINNPAQAHDGILTQVPIIGIAPTDYWKALSGMDRGKVYHTTWKALNDLVGACRAHGFPISFMQFDVGDESNGELPPVSKFKIVEES